MATNPYTGTDNSGYWQQGFIAGFFFPDSDLTAPSPLTPDAQSIYSEGALAGQSTANSGRGLTLSLPGEGSETVKNAIERAEEVGDSYRLYCELKAAQTLAKGAAAFSEFLLISFVLKILISPDRPPYLEEAAKDALGSLAANLAQSNGVPDAFDLYVAVCDQSSATDPNGDVLQQRGWWHGQVYTTYDPALAEANGQNAPDDTIVLHVQSTSPDIIELLRLPQAA